MKRARGWMACCLRLRRASELHSRAGFDFEGDTFLDHDDDILGRASTMGLA
jgi:hypothetical protein